jgi:hypothetical protein
MFYDTAKNDHGLPRDPFKAIVAPPANRLDHLHERER